MFCVSLVLAQVLSDSTLENFTFFRQVTSPGGGMLLQCKRSGETVLLKEHHGPLLCVI